MNDRPEMTEITRYMYRSATGRRLSLSKAISQLQNDAHIRTTADILSKFTGIPASTPSILQAFICDKLSEISPELSRDSIRRKVSMWIKDNMSISKDTAIGLCFALGLDLDSADEMLKYLSGEGFHWRDPEEIVYIFSLMNNIPYSEMQGIKTRMAQKGLLSGAASGDAMVYTEQVKANVCSLAAEQELEEYLRSAQNELGKLHNTAYEIFMNLMSVLQDIDVDYDMAEALTDSDGNADAEQDMLSNAEYSMQEILTIYMHNSQIPRQARPRIAKKGGSKEHNELVLSAVQKNIRQNWPDEITLSKMKNRSIDVTRKVIVLLFLATDGYDDDFYDDIEDEPSAEESFAGMYARLNNMLNNCGFAPLDSRVPFDWMVLYCMCSGDRDFIDTRIEQFLGKVFEGAQ